MKVQFPKKLDFLVTTPARYKVLYGGRGAGKTENIAAALVTLAFKKRLRIACFRDIMKSIDESVKATIEQKIHDLGLSAHFTILDKKIICTRTGSEFLFLGLRYNINSIKSLFKIDIAWVEEAKDVTKSSWVKLGPTIRGRHESDPNGMGGPFGKGPEIWISFNPELDEDETYKRFVLQREKHGFPDYITNELGEQERYCISVKVNYTDNKWFPPDQRKEMEALRNANYDEYMHVWEGHTKVVLDGAIYAAEIRKAMKEGRIGSFKYDDSRPVFTFWDLGFADHTAIWFAQRIGMEYNLINYFQDQMKKMPYYIEYMQSLGYVYGGHNLPHDGDNEHLGTGRTPAAALRKSYPQLVKIVPRVAKKDFGIRAVRMIFDACNFDADNCADGLQCLRKYCYAVNEDGVYSKTPEHNQFSHGSDAFQTFALSFKSEVASKPKPKQSNNVVPFTSSTSINGWMG